MPHIHTAPNQHDITISAYIVLTDGLEPRVLVHMHRKYGKLMQIGGHVELDETTWHAVAREIAEESGYDLSTLQLLQPSEPITLEGAVAHPVPAMHNTHQISDTHYHTDLCYAFVASQKLVAKPGEGESEDLRWLTLAELAAEVQAGTAAKDTYSMYRAVVEQFLPNYQQFPAISFSVEKPDSMSL